MFDRTFIITIKRNESKFNDTLNHLHSNHIFPETFYGLDYKVSGLQTNWTYEVDHPMTGYVMEPRTTNIYMSHWLLWKCCEFSNADSFLILEDDVRFIPEWRENLSSAIFNMDDDWDMLFLGSCCCSGRQHKHVKGTLYETKYACCTHAYAFKRKALDVLIRKMGRVWTGVDIAMIFEAFPHLKTYVILPRIANQEGLELPE